MRPGRLLVSLTSLLLVVPVATAYGAEPATQEVNVHVLPSDVLAISVDGWADFGAMEIAEARQHDFGLNVLNTTSGGWEVTVTGDDLYSFEWEGCDENGCYNPIPTDPMYTIAKSNLVVTGGDLDWWDGEDPTGDTIRPFVGSPGDVGTPTTILQATSYAHGDFGLDNAWSKLELTIPADAEVMHQYRTELVYTITGWTP